MYLWWGEEKRYLREWESTRVSNLDTYISIPIRREPGRCHWVSLDALALTLGIPFRLHSLRFCTDERSNLDLAQVKKARVNGGIVRKPDPELLEHRIQLHTVLSPWFPHEVLFLHKRDDLALYQRWQLLTFPRLAHPSPPYAADLQVAPVKRIYLALDLFRFPIVCNSNSRLFSLGPGCNALPKVFKFQGQVCHRGDKSLSQCVSYDQQNADKYLSYQLTRFSHNEGR